MNFIRSKGCLLRGRTAYLRFAAAVLALVFLSYILTSCGSTHEPGTSDEAVLPSIDLWSTDESGTLIPTREDCGILAGNAAAGGHFVFTLTDSVLPSHAPIPGNGSERVVFAQLYETLVNVDCGGEARPGLAESWTCAEDSTVWIFTIRKGARFWDGTRITPEDVRRVLSDILTQAVDVQDDRRIAVRLPEPHARFPMLMAHPATAVSITRPGWIWPVGSGPCRLRASDPAPLPDLACLPNHNHPAGPTWKSLTFRISPGADPRDLVATDMDLILVQGMDAVRFFDDAPGFHPVPLPWSRLYLLVCPPEMNPHRGERWIQAAAKMDIGRDVTAVSARSWPEIVFPAGGEDRCPRVKSPVTIAKSARLDWNLAKKNLDQDVIAYPSGDACAREMAHRLGALAGGPARTAALPDGGIDFTLQWQMAGAFVLPLDQQYSTGCLQMATLLGKADWLLEAALGQAEQSADDSLAAADRYAAPSHEPPTEALIRKGLVRPLGLSRSWLVVRGSLAGLELAFDGVPLLAGLGETTEAAPGEAAP